MEAFKLNTSFSHLAFASFSLWLDNYLVKDKGCWAAKSGIFYPYTGHLNALPTFGSTQAQFVYDSGIAGPNVISGAFINGNNFVLHGISGVKIDYKHGRVLTQSSLAGATITGSFAAKEFNIYNLEKSSEVLIDTAFSTARDRYTKPNSYVDPNAVVVPCINLTIVNQSNIPFAYGGEDLTKVNIRATILTDNNFRMDGAINAFADMQERCIAYIDSAAALPFNIYGDLKSGVFSYSQTAAGFIDKLFVEKSFATKVGEIMNGETTFHIGYAEITICKNRFPRQ